MQQKRLHRLKTLLASLKPMRVFAEENPEPVAPAHTEPPAPAAPAAPKTPVVDIDAQIQKARTEERNKLYGTIDALKADKNRLVADLSEANKTIDKLQKDLVKAQAAEEGFKSTKEKVTQFETTNETLKSENERLTKELADALAKYDSREQELAVSKTREAILAEFNGEVIEELITGTTEEELRASAQAAHDRYKSIIQAANPAAVVNAPSQMPRPNPNPTQLRNTHQNPTVDLSSIDLSTKAGRDQYAEMRKSLGLV